MLQSRLGLVFGVLTMAAFLAVGAAPSAAVSHQEHAVTPSPKPVAFESTMRELWEDHVVWTRLYIISVAAGLPDQEATAERLVRNQSEIGEALKPYYGEAAGEALTALLTTHIQGAADLLAAAKAGDSAKVEIATAAWYANANEIAAFLHAANPDYWPLADMQAQMKMHLDLTLREAEARLQGDWPADVAAYDAVHSHILAWADTLSAGVIQQFPERFA